MVVVFSERMLPETMNTFWGALERGETVTDAAKEVGTYREKGGAPGLTVGEFALRAGVGLRAG